jgi:[protein-PII] uridylyltransferase
VIEATGGLIRGSKSQAKETLAGCKISSDEVDDVWKLFDDGYYLRHRSDEIVWHTELLAGAQSRGAGGLVDVRLQKNGDGVEAVLYTPRIRHTFAHATAVLDALGMNIVDARIVPIAAGYSIDTYIFMELDKRMDIDDARLNKIRRSLSRILTAADETTAKVTRAAPRRVRMFNTSTSVQFGKNTQDGRTVMNLVAADQPGLLSKVGQVFIELGIYIDAAKIMTIGERAEDVFYICDEAGKPIDEATKTRLRDALVDKLDNKCKT